MKVKAVRVERIKLVIGKQEIDLSLDEAQELKEVLKETFGEHVWEMVPQPYIPYPYVQPWWEINGTNWKCPPNWAIRYDAHTSTLHLSS